MTSASLPLGPSALTIADAALPGSRAFWKDSLLVASAALLTAVSAQVAVPWFPVPMTGQTFAVLLTGAALGWKRGLVGQMTYLAMGAFGLPVFAEGMNAVAFAGPTGGYLMAFPMAAAVTGFLSERGWDRKFFTMILSMILGLLVIYSVGLIGLTRFVPASDLLAKGMLPFLFGDLAKILAAGLLMPAAWKLVRR